MAGVAGPDAASLRRSGGRVSDATREETKLQLLGRKEIAFAVAVLVGCGSASSRGVRVEFFPGPIDRKLQAASRDAVVRVLERHGARVVRSRPSSVEAVLGVECPERRLVATLRYDRSGRDQALAVRLCPAERATDAGCAKDAEEERPVGPCRERTDDLLSSIERDLANHLLARTEVAYDDGEPWWKRPLTSFLSLLSLRRWLGPGDAVWSSPSRANAVGGAP